MTATRLVHPTPSSSLPPLLIKSILAESLKNQPDNSIVYRDQVIMTYRDFNKRVAQLAHALTKLGVKPGDMVGVMEFDSHRYLEMYFAIPMIGAVLHTINYRLSPAQILYTMKHAEDKFIFCHQTLSPLLKDLLPQLNTVEKVVLLKDKDQEMAVEFDIAGEYETLLSPEPATYDFPEFDENSMATLFYTTGTTGNPKGVCFSHRQLVLHTIATVSSLSIFDHPIAVRYNDVYMPLTPMFHVHAWGIPYLATMIGMKQVYPGPYEPAMLLKLILTHRVTFCHCVPTILGMLVQNPQVKELDLSFFRVIIGGSALPKGLAKATRDLGIEITAGYGLSETCPVISLPYLPKERRESLSEEEELNERVKTGRPILFVDLKLMDDDGNFLPHDGKVIGEIVLRAPWLTVQYYKEKERSEELWAGGYLHTGDMAVVEPGGTVIIVDRKKDVIKSGGEWISSLEMESLISAHPSVKQTAIIGIPDKQWGERPVALIVLKEGQKITDQEIKLHLQTFVDQGRISKWAIPDVYKYVTEIPKTSVGKIDKKLIRSKLAGGEI